MEQFARLLVGIGVLISVIGVVLFIASHTGIPLGRLPGDISVERPNFKFYFPLTTSIILSLLISLLLWLFIRR